MSWLLAQTATPDPLLEWLSRAGSVGILAFAVIAFLRGWIVPGRNYDIVRLERDRALALVYKQAELTADLTVALSKIKSLEAALEQKRIQS